MRLPTNLLTRAAAAARIHQRHHHHLSTLAAKPIPYQHHPPEPTDHPPGKVPQQIWLKTAAKLHLQPGHPLHTLRTHIETHLTCLHPNLFTLHPDLSPITTPTACFDDLLVPPTHPSRLPSDTYYISPTKLLRPHMTAHTPSLLRAGHPAIILSGDVYRRDTVDRTHYPVFHQLDAARLFPAGTPRSNIEDDLKRTLESLADALFPDSKSRWIPGDFPFTTPSFEMEVVWQGVELELLGCGLLQRGVLRRAGVADDVDGWAFGLGLDRVAMVLFDVPDIRLFWSEDERFLKQFRGKGVEARFKSFSVYPKVEKDVSFWVDGAFCDNDFHEVVRGICGDLVEDVRLVDMFEKDGRKSLCFRVSYRSMERSLTHKEVNELDKRVRELVADTLPVILR